MPPFTRAMKAHRSILSVHPRGSGAMDQAMQAAGLRDYIKSEGVATFVQEIFTGSIQTKVGTVSRNDALAQLNRNVGFRRFVSNQWRKEDDQTHEWIPCTYLNLIIKKAVISSNFGFIWLAYHMRSPTKDVIFKPKTATTVTSTLAQRYYPLQAHPGGLKLRAQAGSPLGTLAAYGALADGSVLQEGSKEFHSAIIQALQNVNTPVAMVQGLNAVFQAHCWNGAFGGLAYATQDVWPYYSEHGTNVVAWDPTAAAVPATLAYVQAAYNRVAADFNQWEADVQARRANNTNF